jgi:hypothetical protein
MLGSFDFSVTSGFLATGNTVKVVPVAKKRISAEMAATRCPPAVGVLFSDREASFFAGTNI